MRCMAFIIIFSVDIWLDREKYVRSETQHLSHHKLIRCNASGLFSCADVDTFSAPLS